MRRSTPAQLDPHAGDRTPSPEVDPARLKLDKATVAALKPQATRYEVADAVLPNFRVRVTPNGVKTYAVVYRDHEGRRQRFTIGRHGRDLAPERARQAAEKRLAEAKVCDPGEDPQAEKRKARQAAKAERAVPTLRGFLTETYGPWVRLHLKSGEKELGKITCAWSALLDQRLPEITAWDVEKERARRLKEGITALTTNRELAALSACLSRAVEWKLLEAHPLKHTVRPRKVENDRRVRFLDPDEERRLRVALEAREEGLRATRDSANTWRRERGKEELPDLRRSRWADHLAPMVILSLNTGIRRGELFALEWRDVDLPRRLLTVRAAAAKGGRTRTIPLNDEALAALVGWQQQTGKEGLIFAGRKGGTFDNTRRSWESVLTAAKVEGFRWHDQRHHFASRLVMMGVDLNTVRELLGHADLKMTLRYAHLAPSHLAEAVAKLTPVLPARARGKRA